MLIKKCWSKLGLLILFVILSASSHSCDNHQEKKIKPVLEKGIMDLSGWNFRTDGSVRLNGEWEFYWNRFLYPEDFRNGSGCMYINAFKTWNSLKVQIPGVGKFGFATYRIRLKRKADDRILGLCIPEIWTAYTVLINNKEYYHGKPGKNLHESMPKTGRKTIFFDAHADIIEIIFHVSNFHDINGGMTSPPIIGEAAQLDMFNIICYAADMFLFGIAVIIASIHLIYYFLNRQEKSSFYFGMFCLVIAVRIMVLGTLEGSVFYLVFPNFDWELSKKLINISMCFALPCFLIFIKQHFSQSIIDVIQNIFLSLAFIFSFLFVAFPMRFQSLTMVIFHIILIIFSLYIVYIIIGSIRKRSKEAILFLTGFSFILFTTCNDILYYYQVLDTAYLIHFGLLVFILVYSLLLARNSAWLFARSKEYAAKLREYSYELEEKVRVRTVEVEKVNREKIDLFLNLAHETKTPLNIILLNLEEYIKDAGEDEKIIRIREAIEKLISDMINYLDLDRLEKGKMIYDHQTNTDFSMALINKLNTFSDIFKRYRISVESRIEKELYVRADPVAVDRIITNLLDNAAKYTDFGGQANICLESEEDWLVFTITNTGCSIAKDKLEQVFDPYSRLFMGRPGNQGVGLGLFITKQLINELGGFIGVACPAENEISFRIRIKRCKNLPHAKRISRKIEALAAAPFRRKAEFSFIEGRETVLLVEDNRDLLLSLAAGLSADFNILPAENGFESLEILKNVPCPDIIVSDIMMDRMDGWELFRIISRREATSSVPFLFITARRIDAEKIRGLSAGALDFIYKPFKTKELIYKIRAILNHGKKIRQNELNKAIQLLKNQLYTDRHKRMEEQFLETCKHYVLSPAEIKVARYYLHGDGYKSIAAKLGVSPSTVDTHIRKIREKTGTHTRAEFIILFNT